MTTFCLGERFSYHRLDDVSPQQLELMLQHWLKEQESLRPVYWQQLSVVFCKIKDAKPCAGSLIMHEDKGKDLAGLAPDWRPREYLLFVHYDDRLQQALIFGSMSLQRYRSFVAEFGFLTLGDLSPVPELDGEDELLQHKRDLKPYYDGAEESGDAEAFVLGTNWICTQILGLQQTKQDDQAYLEAELDALLRNDENNALGFTGAIFIAACHPRFHKAFVERELRLLRYRLETCYVNERERIFFTRRWFPELLRIELNPFGQFVGHEEPEFFVRDVREAEHPESLRRRHALMQECFDRLYPGEPQLSFYITGEVQFLPEAFLLGLPVQRGKVCFSYRELPAFLENYLRHEINERILSLKLQHSTSLAVPVWSKVERRRDKFRVSDTTRLAEQYGLCNTQLIAKALWERKTLTDSSPEARVFVEDFALPFIQQLDGHCGGFECEPLLQSAEAMLSPKNTFNLPHEHVLPSSYEALLEYAAQHWPPCMQRLVQQCVGKNHLQYEARLKMAGMLRRCGYTQEQGSVLWCRLFENTFVYAEAERSGRDFLSTEQGTVISYDYEQNKQTGLGVSCKTLMNGGFCPVSDALRTPDIEDCQRGCLADFNKTHSASLQYPIRSPENYFQLSIKRI